MMFMRLRLGLKKESIKNTELVLTSNYRVFMSTSRMSLNVFGFSLPVNQQHWNWMYTGILTPFTKSDFLYKVKL